MRLFFQHGLILVLFASLQMMKKAFCFRNQMTHFFDRYTWYMISRCYYRHIECRGFSTGKFSQLSWTKEVKSYSKDTYKYPRIYLEDKNITVNKSLDIDEENSHYILNVMRLKNDFLIRVFNEYDGEFIGRISINGSNKSRQRTLVINIIEKIRDLNIKDIFPSTLFIAPIKKPR